MQRHYSEWVVGLIKMTMTNQNVQQNANLFTHFDKNPKVF